jgi:hypothetical protein
MTYHGIQLVGGALVLYGLVVVFVEQTTTGVMFTPVGKATAGIGLALALTGAFLDPIVDKNLDEILRKLINR